MRERNQPAADAVSENGLSSHAHALLLRNDGGEESPEPQAILQVTYERIKSDILRGELPPGSRLRIRSLCAQYGVSASTSREVLNRLMGAGLVQAQSRRGFGVAPVSLADLEDVCRVRRVLECATLEQSLRNADERWEANLVAAYHRLSKTEDRLSEPLTDGLAEDWEIRNREFHDALVAGCPSERLLRFRQIVYDESARYRRFSLKTALPARNIHEEHKAIFDAAVKRDVARACRLIEQHIDRTLQIVLAAARKQGRAP
jgi:DNA-binding GntR family transcriptional regulator